MNQSLCGLRVLNTRPKDQAQMLSRGIQDAGGVSIECPALAIEASDSHWITSLPDLSTVSHAIFISANAVYPCFNLLKKNNILWPQHIRVIAIGQASAKALHHCHVQVSDIPEVPDSEHVILLDSLQELKNQTVLLFKGNGGRPLIEEGLRLKGANVVTLQVYQRVMPKMNRQLLDSLWQEDLVDIILLTSEQSMLNLFKMFTKEALTWLQNKPCLVISERLAQSARTLGIRNIIISHPDKVINTLFEQAQ